MRDEANRGKPSSAALPHRLPGLGAAGQTININTLILWFFQWGLTPLIDCGNKADADTLLVLPPSFFEDQGDQALHDKIIRLRDEGIAHSDYSRKPTRRVEAQGRGFMTRSKPFDPLAELGDIERFKRIAWRLKFHCVDQMFNIDRQLKGSGDKAVISGKGIELVEGGTTGISVTFKLNGT